MPIAAMEVEQKLLPIIPFENQKQLKNHDFKKFIFLAMDYIEEFVDIYKYELIQIGLILIAISMLFAAGLVPTKALIMQMIL